MSYFDDASLVMIPSGYKTSKVYSVKPTDGSGDLTFSRSNDTATRVNSAGLIEKVRTNRALYSEDFTNAAWTNLSITVGANATTAPNGTTTADKITPTTSNTVHLIHTNVITSAGEYSFSVYVKAAGYSKVALRESQSVGFYASFDLTSGTIIDSSANQTNTITSVGNGWYRITSTRSYSGTINLGLVPLPNSYTSGDPLFAYAGDGTSGIFAWGAQMEFGDVATDYIATTSAAVSVGPVANVPRLDYLNSSCPRLLLEPQRQNVITFSEQMDNAAWNKIQSSVTANAGTSPDGYTNADKFIPNTSNVIHFVTQTISSVSASWTYSIFAKAAGYDRLILNAFNTNYVGFNLTSGIVESSLGTGVTSANIENYGNGWYRCSITSTSTATGTSVAISVFNAAYTNGNTNPQFAGNGTDGILIYGAQLEQGSYSTSYIPTLGAAVTRGADACSKTGISSLIGQTEGTLFVDLSDVNDLDFPEITIDNNNNTDRIVLTRSAAGNWGFFVASSAASTFSAYSSVSSTSGKFALAYSSAGYALYRNGVQIVTGTYNLPTALSAIRFNGRSSSDFFASKCVKQAIIFPTRLSAADLAALTA